RRVQEQFAPQFLGLGGVAAVAVLDKHRADLLLEEANPLVIRGSCGCRQGRRQDNSDASEGLHACPWIHRSLLKRGESRITREEKPWREYRCERSHRGATSHKVRPGIVFLLKHISNAMPSKKNETCPAILPHAIPWVGVPLFTVCL